MGAGWHEMIAHCNRYKLPAGVVASYKDGNALHNIYAALKYSQVLQPRVMPCTIFMLRYYAVKRGS